MKARMNIITAVLVYLLAFSLGGCGGGGSYTSSNTAAPDIAESNSHDSIKVEPVESKTSSLFLVDRIVQSMKSGAIAFNAPQTIRLRETADIQLLLSMEKTVDQLIRSLEAPGQKEGARVLISSRMQARLTGSEFQITAITPEEQAITSKGETEWKWEVKPLTAGDHNLHLTLSALFDVDGKATQRSVQTFDKTIKVKVTPGQLLIDFVHDNWQWLWAAILVPSLALIFKRKKQ